MGALLAFAPPALAVDFAVNTTTDLHDGDLSDGQCGVGGANCSLRAAVEQSNDNNPTPEDDRIILPSGAYVLTAPTPGSSLHIDEGLEIIGSGTRSTSISSPTTNEGLFDISGGSDVSLARLTLTDGHANGVGGAISVRQTAKLTLDRVALTNNVAKSDTFSSGGGLHVSDTASAHVTNSLFDGNIAETIATGTPYSAAGGAISDEGGEVEVYNSTIARNRALGVAAFGGGISTNGGLTLVNVTLAGNSTGRGTSSGTFQLGGGLVAVGGETVLENTALAANRTDAGEENCSIDSFNPSASVRPQGRNLDTDDTCGLRDDVDLDDTEPLLEAAPANNGGETNSWRIRPASPLVDAAIGCPPPDSKDQRGFDRGPECDIGAFELLPDLAASGSASAGSIPLGGTVTHNVVAANRGVDSATAPRLSFTVPAGLTLVSTAGGACTGGATVQCSLPTIGAGQSRTFSVRLRGAQIGSHATGFSLSAPGDPSLSNNSKGFTTQVTAPAPQGQPSSGQTSSGQTSSFLPGRCANLMLGSGGSDVLGGSAFGDRIRGGAGRDRLRGGGGDDCLEGGPGRDRLDGGAGRDRVNAGSGSDRANGGSGDDRVSGGTGNDRLAGGRGRDRLSGGSGRDSINARDGRRDRVSCGRGRDRVRADRRDRIARDCERVGRR
jgi:Ca2+-binding RTX toxin-like protein